MIYQTWRAAEEIHELPQMKVSRWENHGPNGELSSTTAITRGWSCSKRTSSSYSTNMPWEDSTMAYPIGSMYAIYGNIYHQCTPNVSIYTIHGSYGIIYRWRGPGVPPALNPVTTKPWNLGIDIAKVYPQWMFRGRRRCGTGMEDLEWLAVGYPLGNIHNLLLKIFENGDL